MKYNYKFLRTAAIWSADKFINQPDADLENAVRIQIYCVIITYCLVAIVRHDIKLERSIYEALQILGISLTDNSAAF